MKRLLTLTLAILSLSATAQTPSDPAPPDTSPSISEIATNMGRTLDALQRTVEIARVSSHVLDLSTAMQPGDALLLLPGPDGMRAVPVTDEPLAEAAALIVYRDGTWSMRSLSPGDVPSQEAERVIQRPTPPMHPRLRIGQRHGEIVDLYPDQLTIVENSDRVTFEVSGQVSGDATAFLVDIADAEALESLSATSATDRVRVNAVFEFESMPQWAAWRALPETDALLAALSGESDAETRLSLRRR